MIVTSILAICIIIVYAIFGNIPVLMFAAGMAIGSLIEASGLNTFEGKMEAQER